MTNYNMHFLNMINLLEGTFIEILTSLDKVLSFLPVSNIEDTPISLPILTALITFLLSPLVEIANNKVDVIMTKINHHVKINQKSRDELYQECSNINVFNIEDDLFDKALAYMMKMEYISLDNTSNKYSKMLY